MSWRMPAESAPHDRTWMAFPRAGYTLGDSTAAAEEGYAAWAAVAHAVAEFEPVTMVVDPSERGRAHTMLGTGIEQVEAPLDEFWMRDVGPTFVLDDEQSTLGAVDWIFNGWGAPDWAEWQKSARLAGTVADRAGAQTISSLLVNEGGAIHVDGQGTVLVTDTVQLDAGRNPYADRARVEAELARTIGAAHVVWLPRGLTRDYEDLGTRGHVDMVATMPSPGRILVHTQPNPEHPDYAVTAEIATFLRTQVDARGRPFEVIELPAPEVLRDNDGFVDYSYVNHLVVNGGVIACGYGEDRADVAAAEILADAYPGRRVVTVDARAILARGGGIHCITQQQPSVAGARS